MRILYLIPVVVILSVILADTVSGCHRKRKKRALYYDNQVVSFFPGCLRRQLANHEGYENQNWHGSVSYAVFHSNWYEATDECCIGARDTVQCWTEALLDFVTGRSPVLRAAQRCVRAYNDVTRNEFTPEPTYPEGFFITDSPSCPPINQTAFSVAMKNTIYITNRQDRTLSDFDDVVQFTQRDMVCGTCSCKQLKTEDADFEFIGGVACGQCWATKLSLGVKKTSRLRDPAKRVAREYGGLRKCPKREYT